MKYIFKKLHPLAGQTNSDKETVIGNISCLAECIITRFSSEEIRQHSTILTVLTESTDVDKRFYSYVMQMTRTSQNLRKWGHLPIITLLFAGIPEIKNKLLHVLKGRQSW